MVPDEFIHRSSVRTPHGRGLNIQVEGDIRFGQHEAKAAKRVGVLISPLSSAADTGFRLHRTVLFADGTSPKRTDVPGFYPSMEDAYAEFVRWSRTSLTLNLPTQDKRDHLKEGAYFHGGRWGDWTRKVTGLTRNGKVRYADAFGGGSSSVKAFLEWATTPITHPDPMEVSRIEEGMSPKPKKLDPFEGAVRRSGSLDWGPGRSTTEAQVGKNHVWATEKSKTEGQLVSLFRRDSTPPHLWLPDERNACAVARSTAEAWVLAELLEGSSGVRSEPSDAYAPTYVDAERQGWVRKTETGHLTLHQGSDEDLRDVVVTQFSRQSPYEVMHLAWLKAPREPWGGEGVWDRGPIKDADLMGAALALTEILVRSDRLGRPLDEHDWKRWQHGLDLDRGQPKTGWSPPARNNGCPRNPDVVEGALELLEGHPQGMADLHAAGKAALAQCHPTYAGATPSVPFELVAWSRDVSVQYTVAADLLGKAVADAIALPDASMAP